MGKAFLLTVGAFNSYSCAFCLQFVEVLIRHTFPLQAENSNCK